MLKTLCGVVGLHKTTLPAYKKRQTKPTRGTNHLNDSTVFSPKTTNSAEIRTNPESAKKANRVTTVNLGSPAKVASNLLSSIPPSTVESHQPAPNAARRATVRAKRPFSGHVRFLRINAPHTSGGDAHAVYFGRGVQCPLYWWHVLCPIRHSPLALSPEAPKSGAFPAPRATGSSRGGV
jgi:hypothetical protein